MTDKNDEYGFATRAVRAGQVRTPEGENSEPIFPTSSYVFATAAEAAARFSGEQPVPYFEVRGAWMRFEPTRW